MHSDPRHTCLDKELKKRRLPIGTQNWAVSKKSIFDKKIEDHLHSIRSMTTQCIDHVSRSRVRKINNGILVVDIDSSFAQQNFTRLHNTLIDLQDALATEHNVAQIHEMRRSIAEFLTHAVFWRAGDKLTDSEWRTDYFNEIEVVFERIAAAIAAAAKRRTPRPNEQPKVDE